jgi:D-alanine-D-alanine ligase
MARITVITGGSTPERNVALGGAGLVASALRQRDHEVVVVDTASGALSRGDEATLLDPAVALAAPSEEQLEAVRSREDLAGLVATGEVAEADLIFPVLHGRQGEGGQFQALLELADVPFAGSGSVGSLLAMDKDVSKRLFRDASIPTPAWRLWPADEGEIEALGLPLVVKPSRVGSTIGLTVVYRLERLAEAVDLALRYDREVLLESFVDGRELTVGILGGEALAVGEILPEHEIFDYECKYRPGMCEEVFPAAISPEVEERAKQLAVQVHRTLKLRDFSRVDFRVDAEERLYCLEANTLPGMTPTSLLPQSAAAAGLPFEQLCQTICELALERQLVTS